MISSCPWPGILISGRRLLQVFQRKISSWTHQIDIIHLLVLRAMLRMQNDFLIGLIARTAWSMGFGNANMGTLYIRGF